MVCKSMLVRFFKRLESACIELFKLELVGFLRRCLMLLVCWLLTFWWGFLLLVVVGDWAKKTKFKGIQNYFLHGYLGVP
jgi:hypothetical protein